MEKKYLDTDSLTLLINEMSKYCDSLTAQRIVLQEAGTACDAVLGGEAISKKYVSRIEEVLEAIDNVRNMAEQVQDSLNNELRHAMEIYGD